MSSADALRNTMPPFFAEMHGGAKWFLRRTVTTLVCGLMYTTFAMRAIHQYQLAATGWPLSLQPAFWRLGVDAEAWYMVYQGVGDRLLQET